MNRSLLQAERSRVHSHRGVYCRMAVIFAMLCITLPLSPGSVQGAPSVRSLRVEKNNLGLGTVAQFSSQRVSFTLRNASSREIEIYGVRSTCVCLGVDIDRRRLPPGTVAVLTAELDTSGTIPKPRVFHTYVLSRAQEDGQKEVLDLAFSVTIPPRAVFSPAGRTLDFGDVRAGSPVSRRIAWKFLSEETDGVSGVTASADWIGIDVVHPEGLKGVTYVDVRILASAPHGNLNETVELAFEEEAIPRQTFRVTGYVRGGVDIIPRMCFLPLAAKDETVLLFWSPAGDAFKLHLARSDPEGRIEISPLATESSAIHRVKVSAHVGTERFYKTSLEFRAVLDTGKTELLRVPVTVITGSSD